MTCSGRKEAGDTTVIKALEQSLVNIFKKNLTVAQGINSVGLFCLFVCWIFYMHYYTDIITHGRPFLNQSSALVGTS